MVEISQKFIAKKAELWANRKEVKNEIKASSFEIRKKAQETIKEVKDLVGLQNVRF